MNKNPYGDVESEALPQPELIKKKILKKKEEAQKTLIKLRKRPMSKKKLGILQGNVLDYFLDVREQIMNSQAIEEEEKHIVQKLDREFKTPKNIINSRSEWIDILLKLNEMINKVGITKIGRTTGNKYIGYEIFEGIGWNPVKRLKNWQRTLTNITNLAEQIEKKDKDARGIVAGQRGTGKTTFTLHAMKAINQVKDKDKKITEDNFVLSLKDMKKVRNEGISPYDVDELLTLLNAKRAMSNENVETEEILSKMRYRNTFGFWCTTQLSNLTNSHLDEFDFLVEMIEEGKFKFYNANKLEEFEKKGGEWEKPTENWIGHFPKLRGDLWNRYINQIEPEKDKTRKEIREKDEDDKNKYDHECNICGHQWVGWKESPAKCPKCRKPGWDDEDKE